jgi:hypothetical protein
LPVRFGEWIYPAAALGSALLRLGLESDYMTMAELCCYSYIYLYPGNRGLGPPPDLYFNKWLIDFER